LFSFGGITRFYRGIVRNVEQTGDPDLPNAGTRISDVEASKLDAFLARLEDFEGRSLLLHLAEGIDDRGHEHFEALRIDDTEWAITKALSGIHSLALDDADFEIVERFGGSMVWSPLSNLLLYGKTANVAAAKDRGIRIGLGSDWSVSGSKNLLGELKVARLVSEDAGGIFTDRELVAMATREAADILGWGGALGTIEPGKRADLLVVDGEDGDAYGNLIAATEEGVRLVVINGVPRYGRLSLMNRFDSETERWSVGGVDRALNLLQAEADPAVGSLTLAQARDMLTDGLSRLP
jgi:5-methylthioadenosine/S-adenosylhomocysteine deaminase